MTFRDSVLKGGLIPTRASRSSGAGAAAIAYFTGGKLYDAFGKGAIFWLPAENLAERARQDRVPYDTWREQGYLNTTPGNAIEYEYVDGGPESFEFQVTTTFTNHLSRTRAWVSSEATQLVVPVG